MCRIALLGSLSKLSVNQWAPSRTCKLYPGPLAARGAYEISFWTKGLLD